MLSEQEKRCKVDGCLKVRNAKGLCGMHYHRLRKHGDANYIPKPPANLIIGPGDKVCKIEDCLKKVHIQGVCSMHYDRLRYHGDPTGILKKGKRKYDGVVCKVEGCDNKAVKKYYCRKHYDRFRKHGSTERTQATYVGITCKTKGCKKQAARKGFCKSHYSSWFSLRPAPYKAYAHRIDYAEYVEKGAKGVLICKCTYCGKKYNPTSRDVKSRIAALNGNIKGESRLYCSAKCKKACPTFYAQWNYRGDKIGHTREVPVVFRQMALADRNYTCERCGVKANGLHVHHIEGYTEQPMFSADLNNAIVVCKKCHKAIHKQPGCGYHDYQCSNRHAIM